MGNNTIQQYTTSSLNLVTQHLSGYRLVSMAIINSILENSVCSECKTGQLKIREVVQFTSCGLNKTILPVSLQKMDSMKLILDQCMH
jgi:hypothetical protein